MKKLFASRQGRILALVALVLACLLAWSGTANTNAGPAQQVFGVLLTPVQWAGTAFGNGVGGFFSHLLNAGDLARQNEELTLENQKLRSQLADLDALRAENDGYRAQLELTEANPGCIWLAAEVIGRDPLAQFGCFTLNKGTAQGVAVGQAVVSETGCMVGLIHQATLTQCTVMTLLDPDFNAACLAGSGRQNGILTGNAAVYAQGLTTLTQLPRDTTAAPGDPVTTSGLGGVFPAGLLAGSIDQIGPDESGKTNVALIRPAADPRTLTGALILLQTEAAS